MPNTECCSLCCAWIINTMKSTIYVLTFEPMRMKNETKWKKNLQWKTRWELTVWRWHIIAYAFFNSIFMKKKNKIEKWTKEALPFSYQMHRYHKRWTCVKENFPLFISLYLKSHVCDFHLHFLERFFLILLFLYF